MKKLIVLAAVCIGMLAIPSQSSAATTFSTTCTVSGSISAGTVSGTCTTPLGSVNCTGTLAGSNVSGTCTGSTLLGTATCTLTGTVNAAGGKWTGTGNVNCVLSNGQTVTCSGSGGGKVSSTGKFTGKLTGKCTLV
jgi:hypothetical protein